MTMIFTLKFENFFLFVFSLLILTPTFRRPERLPSNTRHFRVVGLWMSTAFLTLPSGNLT